MTPNSKPARILVVEDENVIAMDIQQQLRTMGYETVGHATRGEQAVALAEALRPDLVLMDIQLAGGMDGIAAAQEIRSRFALPVVFITAFAAEETLARAKLSEPYGYILKPFSARELHNVIEMALYKHGADAALLHSVDSLRRSEQALSATVRRYQRILSNLHGGILLASNEGRVEYANQTFCDLFELDQSPEDLLGMASGDIMNLNTAGYADPVAALARIRALLAQGHAVQDEEVAMTRGRTFLRDFIPLIVDGVSQGRMWTRRDITERKRAEAAHALLEAQLRESQKMEAIGTLAGGIAHDFNNIIATILGNVALASQDSADNPAALQSLEEIRRAAARARDLVQQILAFGRRQATLRRPISLEPVIAESVRLLRATLPARVALRMHCQASTPETLADATLIQQVLINLATNAMQAMGGRPGNIEINLDTVLLDIALAQAHPELDRMHAAHPGRALRLTVRDDGNGMDAGTLARIFEPFFTTKAVDEGTGLGLSVVHGIVAAHEGVIMAESQPGKGAVFSIYLPALRQGPGPDSSVSASADEPAPADTAAVAAGPSGGGHILYLDDDEALVFLVTRLMERRGYRISGYGDAREALDALRNDASGFDLVVTDYNMPGLSGLDVARAVRTIRADLPVVITSGFIDETLSSQAAAANVRELIFKATDVEDLCATIARLAQANAG